MIPRQPSKKLIPKYSLSLFSIISPMNKFLTFAVPVTFATILLSTNTFAEEGSLWQKFVDFFTPSESIEGEGPLYDELKELDAKISKTEGKYSRERRPGNKARLKKDLERMRSERSKLIDEIRKNEKQGKISSEVKQSATSSSSAKPISSQATAINKAICKGDTVFVHDTTYIKDTVTVHDTLYVIVADKPKETAKEDAQENANPASSSN